mmetsp:Transcript_24288/g.38919  ORF Transcript_24288/g.38919 Transcript_24288/m.38919 type:complete len:472 (+) Transcript_24288:94-1509(+)|eukprot:CAMPEP_0115088756 /NCGR_PEP_ID=MMETSP0227-20121206/24209_1 /TAXON_ID=89957 /ORGANISM="Polarella glacialis, Strain CCMP 1383" /LENGTH=471 /DNA_ID=CAMNT_0002479143 /DNA_START=191 /DNA_END=1606 /DNA_ORIENTATION=-
MADAAPSPTDSGAPKPENQAKWLTISDNNMMMARNLTRDMLTVVRNNEIVEAASKDATADAANREKEIAKSKVYAQAKAHEAVISVSFKCIQDIEDAILQTEDSLTKLTHERYKGFATLQVCERRQELREKRPASESFRDVLSDALASEKQILDNMRKDLFDMEEQGKKVIEEMLAKRAVLSHDTGARRLVIAHDISSLKPNLAPAAPGSESPKAHHAAPAAGNAADSADLDATTAHAEKPPQSAEEKKKAQQESKEMIEATMKLLERCAQHRHKTFDLCFKAKQDRDRANHRTEDCLARRTTELAEMKKMLEKHALDVEAAISRAERALDRTERRLDKKDKGKVDKFASDKQLLGQLHAARSRLQDDIRNKFAALEIDNMCRRVTAAKASEAKMKQAMARTNSAPSLGRKPKEIAKFSDTGDLSLSSAAIGGGSEESTRPPSTANKSAATSPGGSKSLKAGAAAGLVLAQ